MHDATRQPRDPIPDAHLGRADIRADYNGVSEAWGVMGGRRVRILSYPKDPKLNRAQ